MLKTNFALAQVQPKCNYSQLMEITLSACGLVHVYI